MRIIQTDTNEGNADFIMAVVVNLLRQIHGRQEAEPIIAKYRQEAKSGNYEHLKAVSKRYVPTLIEFAHSSEVETRLKRSQPERYYVDENE